MTSVRATTNHYTNISSQVVDQPQALQKKSFVATLKKIAGKVVNFFTCGQYCSSSYLSRDDIRAIRNFSQIKRLSFTKKREIAQIQSDGIEKPPFNNSLEGMRTLAREMMELAITCVQEKYIAPQLDDLKKAAHEAPKLLNDLAKNVISIGTRSAKPLFEFLTHINVNSEAMPQLHRVLNWAFKDIKPNEKEVEKTKEFIDKFKEELLSTIKHVPENDKEQLSPCTDKILDWLFNSNHSQLPKSLFENSEHKPSEKLIDHVLQAALQLLAAKKIDHYKQKLDGIIDKLPIIVGESIRINALSITELLSARMAEVIEKMGDEQFTALFDKIVEITGKHITNITDSYEAAEQMARDHKELEEQAKEIVAQSKE